MANDGNWVEWDKTWCIRCISKGLLDFTGNGRKKRFYYGENDLERIPKLQIHIFHRQLDFSSEPGVANELFS